MADSRRTALVPTLVGQGRAGRNVDLVGNSTDLLELVATDPGKQRHPLQQLKLRVHRPPPLERRAAATLT